MNNVIRQCQYQNKRLEALACTISRAREVRSSNPLPLMCCVTRTYGMNILHQKQDCHFAIPTLLKIETADTSVGIRRMLFYFNPCNSVAEIL